LQLQVNTKLDGRSDGVNNSGKNRLFLVIKSYTGDIRRVELLLRSMESHNLEKMPIFLFVPKSDLKQFTYLINQSGQDINVINDEAAIELNKSILIEELKRLPGSIAQQIVKSEAWRFITKSYRKESIDYLCLDSESIFINDFQEQDFYSEGGDLYTVMHGNEALLHLAREKKIFKVERDFVRSCEEMKSVFGRAGANYAFSPTPVLWSSKVWQDLEEYYLKPKKKNILNAIVQRPNELHWYGEALLKYVSIPIQPINPIFRVYHYDWEFFEATKRGETLETLRSQYLGILKQSNWHYELDSGAQAARKSAPSRLVRYIKRNIAKFR
jgi:hypothetical protein